jgi:hypothetical protein
MQEGLDPLLGSSEMAHGALAESAHEPTGPESPDPWRFGTGRLRQIVAYGRKVFDLGRHLGRVEDSRRKPMTEASAVATAVFFTGLLRIRSFNALEPRLGERSFLRLLGKGEDVESLCSADTLGRSLRVMSFQSVQRMYVGMVSQAERNKVFREGWHGALRNFAIDGWEPIASFKRHCSSCLTRQVTKEVRGEKVKVPQYYHAYVVALFLDDRFNVLLDFEPLLPKDVEGCEAKPESKHEGELPAALRLIRRVKATYGWLDVVVADALYANGPLLTVAKDLKLGTVLIAKKEGEQPLKGAYRIWGQTPPQKVVEDEKKQERVELWQTPKLETLDSYDGEIRVVRAHVFDLKKPQQDKHTWCALVTGAPLRLAPEKIIAIARRRWQIENAFHQWTTHWYFDHVFVLDGHAIQTLFGLFFAAHNLLTFFLYLQLKSYGRDRGKDVTKTISRFIDECHDDLSRLPGPIWNTS